MLTYDESDHASYLNFLNHLIEQIMGRKVTHVVRNTDADEGVIIVFDHALRFEVGFSGCEGKMKLHFRDMGPNYAMGSFFSRLPKEYNKLVAMEAPRVIRDREHFDRVYKIVEGMAGHDMTEDQRDYLETLSQLVDAWEEENCDFGKEES